MQIDEGDPLPRANDSVDAMQPVDRWDRVIWMAKSAVLVVAKACDLALEHLLLMWLDGLGQGLVGVHCHVADPVEPCIAERLLEH